MQVQRTLVKSPPELWAEVSDVESLTRHLGELGEIRITRMHPETEVAWEGDAARGTVALEASGWGTKVTLTAEPVEAPAEVEWFADPVATVEIAPVVDVEASEEVAALESAVAPVAEPQPQPVVAEVAAPEAVAADAPRLGFFARLFRRRAAKPVPVAEPEAVVEVAEPEIAEPVAVDLPGPPPGGDPVPPTPSPDPAPPAPDPGPPPPAPDPTPPQIAATPDLEAVLTGVLDDLGAAHHRPFSRG